jgi:hypothetical protein
MPWGKSDEEKRQIELAREAERRAQEADRLARERAEAEAAYWDSPVGRAAQAKQRGDRFFQVELGTASVEGHSTDMFGPSDSSDTRRSGSTAQVLADIEAQGWRLEHAGWVFVQTGMSSREKFLVSGEMASVSGRVEGVYLFRAVDAPAA